MKNLLSIIVITHLFFNYLTILAQQSNVKGTVVDEKNKPLPFVNVYISDSNIGGTTDIKGNFSFIVNSRGEVTIKASMVGYSDFEQNIILGEQSNIDLQIILKEEVIKLQESIVVGSSFSSEKSKGMVLSSQDDSTTPGGAADIFQSLKTLPGLTQVSESAQLYVRGGDPIETLTMLDGATLYHPYTYESAYGGLFSNLNTNTIEGMYFSSGGFSTKYGDVLSGVLDIQTKDEPLSTSFMLGISMASANFDGEIPIVDEKLGFRFTSQQSYTKPIMWFNGALDEFSTSPSSRDFSTSFVYKYSNQGKLKIFGLFAEDKQGVNVDRAEYDGVFDGNSTNNFINLHHTHLFASNLLIKNSISFNRHTNLWTLGILDFNQTDDVYKIRSDIEYQIAKNTKIVTGLEIENRVREYRGVVPEEEYDYRPEGAGEDIDVNIDNYRIGGYGEFEFQNLLGIENLFTVAGIRIDAFPDLNLNTFDPRIGLGYNLTENSTLKFAYGLFHQLPDLRLFSTDDGNPDLESMQAEHFVISYDYTINKNSSLRIEGYHKKYSDLPLEDDIVNYSNNGEGFANGIDIILKGKLPIGFEGWASYGLINTKRKWLEFEELTMSDYDITHNLAIVLNYRLAAMWSAGVNYKYATGRPFTPVVDSQINPLSGIYEPIYGEDNSERYPNYHRLDFRITHLNQLFNKFFTVFYVEAINILDIDNLFGYSYSPDYSERYKIKSYFGRRTIVLGAQVSF
ncbi:MAG: TonB-dependent receptor [Melioribacteraceae bacterium]|nr:TonB-dependent receptor [Melioribacteraceae bacterium]